MTEQTPRSDYQTYLKSQKEIFTKTLTRVLNTSDADYKFGPDGVLTDFSRTLGYFLHPAILERRDQIIAMGVPAELTPHMRLAGTQHEAADDIVIFFDRYRRDVLHAMAGELLKIVEEL